MLISERKSEVRKFRKKPVAIKAIQWDGKLDTAFKISNAVHSSSWRWPGNDTIIVTIFESKRMVEINLGDWIIIDCENIEVCKQDIFELTYEEA